MASGYPVTLDVIPTQGVDNVDSALLLSAMEAVHQPQYLVQSLAYAASIQIDPRLGETVVIAALTGALTLTNPPAASKQLGRRINLQWSQNGAGGNVITFDTDFLSGAAPATTASKTFTQSFVWNGTKWAAVGLSALLN